MFISLHSFNVHTHSHTYIHFTCACFCFPKLIWWLQKKRAWFFVCLHVLVSGLCNYRSAQQRTYNVVTEHPLLSSTSTMATATTPSASIVSSAAAQHQQLKLAAVNGHQVSWHRSHCVYSWYVYSINILLLFPNPSLFLFPIRFVRTRTFCIRRCKIKCHAHLLQCRPYLLLIASTTLFKVWYYWFKLSSIADANSFNHNNIIHSNNNKHIIINIDICDCIGHNDIQTSDAFQSIT